MKTTSLSFSRRHFMELAGTAAALAFGGFAIGSRAGAAANEVTRIGMIGSGNVGSALGRVWAQAGHSVIFSSRNIEHDRALASKVGNNAKAGTPREAAEFGDVIVMAVPYRALPELGKSLADALKGKVVIDACNPFPSRDGEIAEWAREKGAGLATAELLPGARIVRAFNAIGAARMGSAHEQPGRIGMPIAGDDAEAIAIASRLIRDIGYEPVLVGGLDMGKHLMPGTPLAGEHTVGEIKQIAAKL